MRFQRKGRGRRRGQALASELAGRLLARLAERAGRPEQPRLVELWRNWRVVMGEELSALALPLGHSGRRLEVGCEDGAAMQELSYLRGEILERANAFMEEDFFRELRLSLALDRRALDKSPLGEEVRPPARPQERALERAASGVWLPSMDPESPVARCYRAWCAKKP